MGKIVEQSNHNNGDVSKEREIGYIFYDLLHSKFKFYWKRYVKPVVEMTCQPLLKYFFAYFPTLTNVWLVYCTWEMVSYKLWYNRVVKCTFLGRRTVSSYEIQPLENFINVPSATKLPFWWMYNILSLSQYVL